MSHCFSISRFPLCLMVFFLDGRLFMTKKQLKVDLTVSHQLFNEVNLFYSLFS